MDHDLLLVYKDGSQRHFRIYGWPTPKTGDIITLPVDGQPIKAYIKIARERSEFAQSIDTEVMEI